MTSKPIGHINEKTRPTRLSLGLACLTLTALALAGCAARYPLGMSKAEWARLTPQQQQDARMKQGDINRERARRRANAAAAQRAREEAELRRVQALYDEGRWGDVVECVIEGGMADFHPGWRRFRPIPFTVARGESKRITLREDGRRVGGFYASFSGNGTDLRICYRDPRHWGRYCTNIPVTRRRFSDGYASRITVRDVFQNADLYCAYRPGYGMPRVRLYRENRHIWATLYRYHYPDAPPPSRVVYYDRRYHDHHARYGRRDDHQRRPQPQYEDRDRYRSRYDGPPRRDDGRDRDRRDARRDDRDRYARERERERERINPRPTTGAAAAAKDYLDRRRQRTEPPHQRAEPPRDNRDRYAKERDRERMSPRPTTGAAAAAKAYIDSTRRPAEPRDDRTRRDDRGNEHVTRREDRHGRQEDVRVGHDVRVRGNDVSVGNDVRVRGNDVRVGNVRVRQDNVRTGPPPGKSPPPGHARRGSTSAPPAASASAVGGPKPPPAKGPPPGRANASNRSGKTAHPGKKPPLPQQPGNPNHGKPGETGQPQLRAK